MVRGKREPLFGHRGKINFEALSAALTSRIRNASDGNSTRVIGIGIAETDDGRYIAVHRLLPIS